jgi:hypothetical protein
LAQQCEGSWAALPLFLFLFFCGVFLGAAPSAHAGSH